MWHRAAITKNPWSSLIFHCWGMGTLVTLCISDEEGDRIEVTGHGLHQEARMSTLPHPEILTLALSCFALFPKLCARAGSFALM